MITRREEQEAREWAWQTARRAGLILHDGAVRIEVADFGLSRLKSIRGTNPYPGSERVGIHQSVDSRALAAGAAASPPTVCR